MTNSDTRPTEQGETRPCLLCERAVLVVGKVGPIDIKEPCPNKCATGYVRAIRKDAE